MRIKTLLSVRGLTFGTHVQNNSIKYHKSNNTDLRDQEKRQVLVLNARILTDFEGHVYLGSTHSRLKPMRDTNQKKDT